MSSLCPRCGTGTLHKTYDLITLAPYLSCLACGFEVFTEKEIAESEAFELMRRNPRRRLPSVRGMKL